MQFLFMCRLFSVAWHALYLRIGYSVTVVSRTDRSLLYESVTLRRVPWLLLYALRKAARKIESINEAEQFNVHSLVLHSLGLLLLSKFLAKVTMTELIRDSLILARNLGMDVFNALNLMQNKEFLQVRITSLCFPWQFLT